MPERRLLVVGLDAYDAEVGAALMRAGELPVLSGLHDTAARFDLDHGIEKYTGLAWEQFATGRSPQEAQRWAACTFDTATYSIDQPTTRLAPFAAQLDASAVVFDTPYFDLANAPSVRGMVSWGSHDPGVPPYCNPPALRDEIQARFGPYPAEPYIYGHVWPDVARTVDMGRALVAAVERRSAVTRWLFGTRLQEWQLGMTVLSEFHSATEALWHGWDEDHPLHVVPSASAARVGLVDVYRAADRMLGDLIDAFPDASILAFAPHGMGRNHSDTAAMILMSELLYAHYTGRRALEPAADWQIDGRAGAEFAAYEDWSSAVNKRIAVGPHRRGLAGLRDKVRSWHSPLPPPTGLRAVDWMPAMRYRTAWPSMRAFAVPAYYDARIRINLAGRESLGIVRPRDYDAALDEVETLIRECTDPRNGKPLAVTFERRPGDPRLRHTSDVDLVIRIDDDHYAFDHPRLGRIGPVPCRRTGGHSGGLGIGYLTRAGRSGPVGRFPTLEVSHLVRALAGDHAAKAPLVDAVNGTTRA